MPAAEDLTGASGLQPARLECYPVWLWLWCTDLLWRCQVSLTADESTDVADESTDDESTDDGSIGRFIFLRS